MAVEHEPFHDTFANLDLISWLRQLVSNYPPLVHYTQEASLRQLLTSKSLMARPVWDFADEAEYVYGLQIIARKLKYIRINGRRSGELYEMLRQTYPRVEIPIRVILDHVIHNILYEIEHSKNPNVQVYVTCLSEIPASDAMMRRYGPCVIHFNFLLPLLAYSTPAPFTSSMLSRVTYNRDEFISAIPRMGFFLKYDSNVSSQETELLSRSEDVRRKIIANWITEKLCLFAPNIKHPSFAYEKEWRIKSAISTYANTPSVPKRKETAVLAWLPSIARFTDEQRSRYLHQFTDHEGRFISQLIANYFPKDKELSIWTSEWQRDHSMPLMSADEFFIHLANVD